MMELAESKVEKYVYKDTNVIQEHASRLEKFEDGAGAMFRRVCENAGLVAHTANYDNRNTWFSGDGKASSLIDYIAGPALLHIRKAGQLARLGSILQPVDINREVDHKPSFICFYTGMDKSKFTLPPQTGMESESNNGRAKNRQSEAFLCASSGRAPSDTTRRPSHPTSPTHP